MRLHEKRLKQSLVRFDLTLKLFVLFGSKARLVRVGNNVVEIDLRTVGAQDGAIEAPLLASQTRRLDRNDVGS